MLVLCTYPLNVSRAMDVLDVIRMHHFSVSIRNGRWEALQAPQLAGTPRELGRFNNPVDVIANSAAVRRLTRGEQVVLDHLVTGAFSKEVVRVLSISPRTVEFHRGNIMRKFGARNIADLVAIVVGTR
jgi:DNA-binding CsgD family transcriptional regulator